MRRARDRLSRVKSRPNLSDWADDEAMTLAEAIQLFFPEGPLTLSSLRTAIRTGKLAVAKVAGKDLTTPRAVKALVRPCLAEKRALHGSSTEPTKAIGTSSIVDGKAAQAALATKLKERRARSKPTSQKSTPLQSVLVIPLHS